MLLNNLWNYGVYISGRNVIVDNFFIFIFFVEDFLKDGFIFVGIICFNKLYILDLLKVNSIR